MKEISLDHYIDILETMHKVKRNEIYDEIYLNRIKMELNNQLKGN